VHAGAAAKVRQVAYVVQRPYKLAALGRVLDVEHPTSAIVFCRTRLEVDELAGTLTARGHRAEALHGGLSQDQRDRVMQKFRGRKIDLLIATDVAARGLDVQHVSHVVTTTSRSRRTTTSTASAVPARRPGGRGHHVRRPREQRLLHNIERVTRQRIEIAPVPSIADLRARRLETTRAALRDTLSSGSLEAYRRIAESLAEEFDPLDVAAARSNEPSLQPATHRRKRSPRRRLPGGATRAA